MFPPGSLLASMANSFISPPAMWLMHPQIRSWPVCRMKLGGTSPAKRWSKCFLPTASLHALSIHSESARSVNENRIIRQALDLWKDLALHVTTSFAALPSAESLERGG